MLKQEKKKTVVQDELSALVNTCSLHVEHD